MDFLSQYRPLMLGALDGALGGGGPLEAMCRYHMGLADAGGAPATGGNGKMLRAALTLAVCEAMGGRAGDALPAALAFELAHRSSLVFDDIQDKSPLRNHRPTVWKVWGTEQALNCGLALSAQARLAVIRSQLPGPRQLDILGVLEEMVLDLATGQHMDIAFGSSFPSLSEYVTMVALKTGALLGAACEAGAIVATGSTSRVRQAREFGEAFGVLFQLQDDILGAFGAEAETGKSAVDVAARKRTLPIVILSELDSRARPLLMRPPGDETATGGLRELLDDWGCRDRAAGIAARWRVKAEAGVMAMGLPSEWSARFNAVTSFAASRSL